MLLDMVFLVPIITVSFLRTKLCSVPYFPFYLFTHFRCQEVLSVMSCQSEVMVSNLCAYPKDREAFWFDDGIELCGSM